MYVRIVTFNFSLKCFSFVVGTWWLAVGTIFFSVSITYGATHAGRILFDTMRKCENSRVWPLEVRVMLLFDTSRSMNDSYGYTIVNCVWPHYSSILQLAGVVCISQLTQAGDVFVFTSGRSRSMYYVDHLDPNLPFGGAVQGLHNTDPTQETCPRECSMCGSYPATWPRSHRLGIYLPWKSWLVQWESIIICPTCAN